MGAGLLWDWLAEPGDTRRFWLALGAGGVVAVIVFVVMAKPRVSPPRGRLGIVLVAAAATPFALLWSLDLPTLVVVALVVGAWGAFLGFLALEVRDLVRR